MLEAESFDELLYQAGERFGDKIFLADDGLLGPITYRQARSFAQAVKSKLDELEIPEGSFVATAFHNCSLAALLFLAVIGARRELIPLNPLSTKSEFDYMLDLAQCAAVIVDPNHVRTHEFGDRKIISVPKHSEFFETLMGGRSNRRHAGAPSSGSVHRASEVVFTSGSTGRPKGARLSEQSLLSNARALAEVYELDASDRFLTVCPLFHNSGQVFTTLSCALVGGTTAAVKSDVGMLRFWHCVEKYQAHWSLGMVSFLALLLSRPSQPAADVSMRGLLTGGSAIDAALIASFEARFNIPVRTVYGLTESASIATCEYRDPDPRSLGSSGRPLPICDVRLGSDPGSLVAADDPRARDRGEIWIAGPTVFEGYLGDAALTEQRKIGEWLKTGDLGYYDERGNLFVVDRLDSMLIVGGENVYPAEVERYCMQLQDAAQIVLTSVEHPIWGAELFLVYKTVGDCSPNVRTWHRVFTDNLAAAKVPQRYLGLSELGLSDFPRKENGKLDRQALSGLVKAHARQSLGASA
ncbi:MAG: class I adenylate-forming enzyme family protein [Pseudomonadota bacterium]|nr:class I adenylate-forming enzyme family protein [Pseudomonadota bacterium]